MHIYLNEVDKMLKSLGENKGAGVMIFHHLSWPLVPKVFVYQLLFCLIGHIAAEFILRVRYGKGLRLSVNYLVNEMDSGGHVDVVYTVFESFLSCEPRHPHPQIMTLGIHGELHRWILS